MTHATLESFRTIARETRSNRAVAVYCDGPFPTTDRDGDEVPEWTVFAGDQDAEPVGTVYRCSTWSGAVSLAAKMARDRRLSLEDESMPA